MNDVPAVLLPYQAEAIRLSRANQLFVCEKSRRTGITYGFAADAVLTASPAIGAQDFFYIAFNLDMTREFIGYVADFAKAFDGATEVSEFLFDDGSEEGIKAYRVDFPSGKAVVALTSKPRSLRGRQGVVFIDEAAFHDELEELLKAALALLMWGGRVIVVSTHDGADNPFNELIENIRAGRKRGEVQRITLEEALDQGLYKRICLRSGQTWSPEAQAKWEADLRDTYGDAASEELDVIPARGSGTFLPRATIEACTTAEYQVIRLAPGRDFETAGGLYDPSLPDEGLGHDVRDAIRRWREIYIDDWLRDHVAPIIATFDPYRRSFFGQDFARSSDLSTVACGQIDPAAVLHNRLGIEMRNVPFWAQKRVLDFLCRTMPMFSHGKMDARGNGQQLAEDMQETWGASRIEAVMATEKVYLARMPRLKARYEDRTILMPRHDGAIDDLRMIKLVRGVPMVVDRVTDKEDGAKGKRHGDYAIAMMNLVSAADEDIQPIALHTADNPRAMGGDYRTTGTGFGTISRRDDFGARGGF